jgi:hypothetical protein
MNSELKKAIKNSGNNLHLEITETLKEKGWDTDISFYYCDDLTNKPREIDIIARKRIPIFEDKNPEIIKKYNFSVFLFLECKNFQNQISFRVIDNSFNISKSAIGSQTKNLNIELILKETELKNKHHYLINKNVAKLYDVPYKGKKEKKIDEKLDKQIFESITQPIKSLIFFKKEENISKGVFYPMVIYRGIPGFYIIKKSKNTEKNLDKLKPIKNLIFGLKYSYRKIIGGVAGVFYQTSNFLIDFVHQDELEKFLQKIEENEIPEIRKYLLTEGNKWKEEYSTRSDEDNPFWRS